MHSSTGMGDVSADVVDGEGQDCAYASLLAEARWRVCGLSVPCPENALRVFYAPPGFALLADMRLDGWRLHGSLGRANDICSFVLWILYFCCATGLLMSGDCGGVTGRWAETRHAP